MSKSFQIWDHFFLFLLLKDSEYLKSLDIGHCKVGARGPLNRVNKWKKSVENLDFAGFFHLFTPFKRLLVPTSQSPMTKLFRYSESLSKSIGKKWSRNLKLLLKKGCIITAERKVFFWRIYICWPSSPSVLDKFNKCMPWNSIMRTSADSKLIHTSWL